LLRIVKENEAGNSVSTQAELTGALLGMVPICVPGRSGFSRTASAFTAETDCLLEGTGFEPVWGFSCQVVIFGLLAVLCSEREKPFFVPSLAIRFAERAEGVKGPKR
jgi:hypothetical protein